MMTYECEVKNAAGQIVVVNAATIVEAITLGHKLHTGKDVPESMIRSLENGRYGTYANRKLNGIYRLWWFTVEASIPFSVSN